MQRIKTNGIIANDNTYEEDGDDGNDDKNENDNTGFFHSLQLV